jgi:type I restriction enzyme S subunit
MIGGLKPYPEYKESGVPWLGRVPAHWEVRRNGRLFSQRNEVGFPDLPILEVSLKTGVRIREIGQGRKQIMADRAKYKRAAKGDITYNMMRLWQGAVGAAPEDGILPYNNAGWEKLSILLTFLSEASCAHRRGRFEGHPGGD